MEQGLKNVQSCQFLSRRFDDPYTPYSKMATDLCGYKLALVASFKIKYSLEF